jgi:heat shock protein HslJ
LRAVRGPIDRSRLFVMKVRGLVLLLAAGVIGGCGGGTTDSTLRTQLTNRSFVSESVDGLRLVAGTQVSVSFSGTGVSASAGCNSFFGACDIEDGTLRVSMLGSTEIGCPGPLGAQDDWLSMFLLAGPTLELADPQLVMSTADVQLHLLDRKIAIPDRALVGTQWLGNGFSDGMVASIGPGSSSVTAAFGTDGNVVVNTGCQAGTGSFTVDAGTITFGALKYDGAPCADPTFQQTSSQVLLVLDGSPVTFTISEAMLTVTHGQNALLFHAAP